MHKLPLTFSHHKEGSLNTQNVLKYGFMLKAWKNRLYEFNSNEGLELIRQRNLNSDGIQFERYKEILGIENLPNSIDDFQHLKYTNANEFGVIKAQVKGMGYYNKALENEPEISNTVKDISKVIGVDKLGYESRIKSKARYLEKIRTNYNCIDCKYCNGSTYDIILFCISCMLGYCKTVQNPIFDNIFYNNYSITFLNFEYKNTT